MLAGRRSAVAELNVHGRLRASSPARLTGATLDVDGTPFQAGDAVMTLRNDRRLGVRNGNRGVVVAVDPDAHTMRVRLTRGEVDLPARYVDAGHVGHAYAMTVNKAHGLTCDRTMTLGDDQIYRELAYEALSRGRLSNHVYIPRSCTLDADVELPHARTLDTPGPIETLEQGLQRRHTKQLALDAIATIPLQAWTTSELLTERDRIRSVLGEAPPDRSRDLDALRQARRDTLSDLRQADVDVARLECRKRPFRERRRPDVELIQATNTAQRLRDRVDQLDTEITRVETSRASPGQLPGSAPSRHRPTARHRRRPQRTRSQDDRPRRRRPAQLHHPRPRHPADRPPARPRMGQSRRRHRHLPHRTRHHRPTHHYRANTVRSRRPTRLVRRAGQDQRCAGHARPRRT